MLRPLRLGWRLGVRVRVWLWRRQGRWSWGGAWQVSPQPKDKYIYIYMYILCVKQIQHTRVVYTTGLRGLLIAWVFIEHFLHPDTRRGAGAYAYTCIWIYVSAKTACTSRIAPVTTSSHTT